MNYSLTDSVLGWSFCLSVDTVEAESEIDRGGRGFYLLGRKLCMALLIHDNKVKALKAIIIVMIFLLWGRLGSELKRFGGGGKLPLHLYPLRLIH